MMRGLQRRTTARMSGVVGNLALAAVSLAIANAVASVALRSPSVANRVFSEAAVWRAAWLMRPHAAMLPHDLFDPELGWTLAPNLRDVPLPGTGTVNSESHGVRGAHERALAKPAGEIRIVAIGDSFTFGDEVDDGETFSAALENDLPTAEVLNLGVHGYGHDQMLLRLRRDGLAFAPDVVLLGWVDMDKERDILDFRDYAKPRFELSDGRLVLATSRIPAPAELLRSRRFTPALVLLAEGTWERFRSTDDPARAVAVAAALSAEIARTVRAAGAVPVFVDLPDPRNSTAPSRLMSDLCDAEHIECVFPGNALASAAASGTRLIRVNHYTPDANRIVAASIRRHLEARGLLATRREQASSLAAAR
jgi:hypothetical protein